MFETILVPVDLTERNRRAVEVACGLARGEGARVVVLHVIEVVPGLDMDEDREFYDRLEQRARAHLERLGAGLRETAPRWEAEVVYGSRGREILRRAAELPADLIVLASHRVDPRTGEGAGWGTLSYQIGILAPCSVLLVK